MPSFCPVISPPKLFLVFLETVIHSDYYLNILEKRTVGAAAGKFRKPVTTGFYLFD
jgi:hypothetical protein